jgi:hypothetical protein
MSKFYYNYYYYITLYLAAPGRSHARRRRPARGRALVT